jgi:hypothetical protein
MVLLSLVPAVRPPFCEENPAGGDSLRDAAVEFPDTPRKERPMAVAFLQEFTIQAGDTSTTNYDAVTAELNLQQAPDGLLIHTAGFDHESGVFRVFDVWESREQADTFMTEKLNPIIERMAGQAAASGDESFTPPTREAWYELHDSMTG